MAAGLAHELNNPAAAIRRNAYQAREVFSSLSSRAFELSAHLTPNQQGYVADLPQEIAKLVEESPELDTLAGSDLEDEVADWLDERGIGDAWELAPTLVGVGVGTNWLDVLANRVPNDSLEGVLSWLVAQVRGNGLLREIEGSSERISELVGVVKEYSYMDREPSREEVDLHEGLENTLTILDYKIEKEGVAVLREYDPNLPRVAAYGDELNQIWTALLDNAIDAAHETAGDVPGQVRIRTEPFFTTKEVGSGVGLGLDLARRAVERHSGDIRAVSEPGGTRIEVRLPVEAIG
jgi:signal transduction histidine kinase